MLFKESDLKSLIRRLLCEDEADLFSKLSSFDTDEEFDNRSTDYDPIYDLYSSMLDNA